MAKSSPGSSPSPPEDPPIRGGGLTNTPGEDPTSASGGPKGQGTGDHGGTEKDQETALSRRVTQTKGGKPYDKKRTKPIKNQCTAFSKRTQERCGLASAKGQSVCRFHGGATTASIAAGKRREAKREAMLQASRLVQKDGVHMDPIDHLLDSLYRASQLVQVYGVMCAEIDNSEGESLSDDKTRGELGYEIVEEEEASGRVLTRFVVKSRERLLALNKHSEAQLHPFLVAYTEALRDRARFAKMAIDAGIAEMQMELVERQVDMAQEALEATIQEMKLDQAKRRAFVESYARNLRVIGMRDSSLSPKLLNAKSS